MKKRKRKPLDPERERWLMLISRAELVAAQALVEAHLRRELRLAQKSILDGLEGTEGGEKR